MHDYYLSKSVNSIDEGYRMFELISNKKWEDLGEQLPSGKCSEGQEYDARCQSCNKRHSLLHFACHFQPPLYVVKQLDDICPDAVYQPDCKNQFPLHIAVENRASAKVQSYLISRNSFAAKVPDINGKTPLHLLFLNYHERRNSDPKNHAKQTLENMKLLSDAAPMSVFVQDSTGKTALQCAAFENAEHKIQKQLQQVAAHKVNATYQQRRRRSWDPKALSDAFSAFSYDSNTKSKPECVVHGFVEPKLVRKSQKAATPNTNTHSLPQRRSVGSSLMELADRMKHTFPK